MNALHIIGNLTRDPEKRQAAGKDVCHITVAVDRYAGNNETKVDFFSVSLWGAACDNAVRYLRKGSKVAVSGSVTMRTYEGQDGQARANLEIVGPVRVEYLSRSGGAGATGATGAAGDAGGAGGVPEGFTQLPDDDQLPF